MIEILKLIFSPLLELVEWIVKKFQKPDPVLVLKRREELRREFERKLPQKDKYGVHCEAIIRDIKCMDSYPNTNTVEKGISSWFGVEVKGLYHRGIEVFISMPKYIKRDKSGRWSFADDDDTEEKVLAYPVGRIPFDLIEYVNWDGDEYYPSPHIYCRFKALDGQPYESIPFFAKEGRNPEYLIEVKEFRPWDRKKVIGFQNLKNKEIYPSAY